MIRFLSRYHLRYPRSLAYMLQATEYILSDYFAWYGRVKDFAHVERRKHLVKTKKAIATWSFLWVLLLFLYALSVSLLWLPWGWLGALILFVLTPTLVAYLVAVPLLLGQWLMQKPMEARALRRASEILAKHKGLRIGIAGSFGKTSMREALKAVLTEGKKVASPPENHNTPLGICKFIETLQGDEDIIIFELGEYYPGDVRKLCELVKPDMGVITGVNEAHLHKFKTLDRTVGTVFELADYLGGKPLYVNGENSLAAERATSYTATLYSRNLAKDFSSDLEGTTFTLEGIGDLHSRLLGLHQVGPLVAACLIGQKLGLTPEQIRVGISHTAPFDHRLEARTAGGVTTLDDSYNGNPDGARAVIEFLGSLQGHRRLYVTPGLVEMGPKTEQVHRAIGAQLAAASIEVVLLVRNSVTPYIEAGLKESNFSGKIQWFDDALTLYSSLSVLTLPGDVVLLQNDWPDQYA